MAAEILGVGMVTPLGVNAPAAAAAIRAGLAAMSSSSLRDHNLDRLVACLVDVGVLPPVEALGASARHARILRLAAPAAAEAMQDAPSEPIPAFVGLPEPPQGRRDPIGASFLSDLAGAAGIALDVRQSRVFRQGRAAALFALEAALGHLDRTRNGLALVGAADTYLDLRLLADLELEGRIRTRGISDAFIPGEGAAFLLLAPSGRGRRRDRAPLAEIVAAATGFETGHLYSQEPYRGEGLADTMATLFARAPGVAPARCVYASWSGESFWAKEWGVARIRSAARFAGETIEHPADCIGDTGAASGALMLALAAVGLDRGYRKGPIVVFSSADRGERAASLLSTLRR